MRFIFVILASMVLVGCNTTQSITNTKYKLIMPDQSLYYCPINKKFPDPTNLTDVQVARTLIELYKNNQTCKNSIEAIKSFLERSKVSIEK